MRLPEIKLNDPLYCDGCPCLVTHHFQAHCLFYNTELAIDTETTERQSFMKVLRPERCIKDNQE